MTKIIKIEDGTYIAIDTEFNDFEEYLANVPTQDYEGENYFCPGIGKEGNPMWCPISGAEFIDCEIMQKTDNLIPEACKDIETKVLYIEHVDGVWNIIDNDNVVLGTWTDIAFNQNKIDRTIKRVEEESSAEVILKFKLEDMTANELKKCLNKNWDSIQALEKREAELVDECLDGIQSLISDGHRGIESDLKFSKRRGCIHDYRMEERSVVVREKPLMLEGKALIDKLFSMIEGEE